MPSRSNKPVAAIVASFAIAAASLVATAAPIAAAGVSCPVYYSPHGTNPTVVRVGEQVQFWNNYTDFGQPGTVHAVFTGPHGRTREATAANLPDGAYFINETFRTADVGRWHVAITVDEVGGHADCTATFRVVAVAGSGKVPDTATADPEAASQPVAPAGGLLLAAGVLAGLLVLRRRPASH